MQALAPMEAVTQPRASKLELKAHMQEVETAHKHESRYTAKVGCICRASGLWTAAHASFMAVEVAHVLAHRQRFDDATHDVA